VSYPHQSAYLSEKFLSGPKKQPRTSRYTSATRSECAESREYGLCRPKVRMVPGVIVVGGEIASAFGNQSQTYES
jgi:hypothetical protein